MTQITITLPSALYEEIQRLVQSGWFRDENELVAEAIRRFLESHRPEMMAAYVKEDIQWGLHGND